MATAEFAQLPFSFAKRHSVLLASEPDQGLPVIYVQQPISLSLYSELRRYVGCELSIQQLAAEQFQQTMAELYESSASKTLAGISDELESASMAESITEAEDLLEQEDEAPIIRLINAILAEAIQAQASDIHLETFEKNLSVRFRIDGLLKEVAQPRRELAALLISRIKVMAGLDIAEKRIPQDGRISLKLGGREVDVRVSTLPSIYGERIVLRLLDKQDQTISLDALGICPEDSQRLQNLLSLSHGILLVTGPTGSGKTTTLYAGLNRINDRKKNILTVEDPVEYHIDGIGQTQVNNKAGMTFAKGLRAILRQDPDVVMVGEIRDLETMQIAVQASLTGHLVLSTLHTNTAAGAVTRLMDMGIEPFLLSSSLVGVLAQRLVRKLCSHCKQSHAITEAERQLFPEVSDQQIIYTPQLEGCDQCNQEGYKGRTGIYELIVIDDNLRQLIHDRAAQSSLVASARTTSTSIRQDGYKKVLSGETSLAEVLRVTQED
ncbi:type II secretion system ATPase GspE [Porticoccaceae bacterium]|jgi:general secretion pathway protein E|nr:type II secretion system ATPase GspE [Porticoccaceae bacterium]